MLADTWACLLHLYTVFHQLMVPCSHPEQLLVNSVNRQQYLGKWHFEAAVSRRGADIQKFKVLDSVVFTMEETDNKTLVLTGHMRMGDDCVKQTWSYQIQPGRDDLILQGRPQRRNLLWSGAWANCPDCIIFQEVEPPLSESDSEDSLNRYMLYGELLSPRNSRMRVKALSLSQKAFFPGLETHPECTLPLAQWLLDMGTGDPCDPKWKKRHIWAYPQWEIPRKPPEGDILPDDSFS